MMKHRDRGDEVLMCNEDMLAQQKVLWKYDGDMCIAADGGEKIQQYARKEKKCVQDEWVATPSLHHHRSLPAVRYGAAAESGGGDSGRGTTGKLQWPIVGSGVEASSSSPPQVSLLACQEEVPWQQENLEIESPSQKLQLLGMQQKEYSRGHWQEEDSIAKEEQNTLGWQHSDHDSEQQNHQQNLVCSM
eukprot:CAMPEP_0194674836 /NCGR_PEP_ID=MMETSP0295-20121207/7898_1 /TAXON_ID=39354 /ORGANISM="Heterosigma akashiwo, Strain CCMP2393" /LENGTH=188 /DNA_ID=CAMNT_0039559053 /DNA_START=301 /DNA_END=866 /DNA_ORIENTATION=-